jgi:hypothetical protein
MTLENSGFFQNVFQFFEKLYCERLYVEKLYLEKFYFKLVCLFTIKFCICIVLGDLLKTSHKKTKKKHLCHFPVDKPEGRDIKEMHTD